MNVLLLGCGVIGVATGRLLVNAGHQVFGIRRHPDGTDAGFPISAGDAADPALYPRIAARFPAVDAVVCAANPGVRRGSGSGREKDNGLVASARLICATYPQARLIYTSTTSVYGDAKGGPVHEESAIDGTPEAQALIAIEQPFLQHRNALILRATALVGPTRTFTRDRLRAANGGELSVKGDLDRPFSYLHEADLADLCVHALLGNMGCGILNAASPQRITVRAYYAALSESAGITLQLKSDGATVPSRWIDAACLHATVGPQYPWRGMLD